MTIGSIKLKDFKEICICKSKRFRVLRVQPFDLARNDLELKLAQACESAFPTLALAVNGEGLDSEGRIFWFLQALKVPVALWFVDNPWHILSRFKFPWWKYARLFVTDASFISALQREGAAHVYFLPLAVAPHMWRKLPWEEETQTFCENWSTSPPVFVGRLAFPSKEKFFAAQHIADTFLHTAQECFENAKAQAELPHIHWWYKVYNCQLWPGHNVRYPGLGAEIFSLKNRVRWLTLASQLGFQIYGDDLWLRYLPTCCVHPPVDYYTQLPMIYYCAKFVLNVTSLQLPQSLSQRHFDVWAAAGFLLSDATQGLNIFPRELTAPIIVKNYQELEVCMKTLQANSTLMCDLRMAWRDCLRREHLYIHRIKKMCEIVL